MKQTYILTSLLCLTVLLMPGCTSPIGSGDDPSSSTLAINFGTPQADTRAAVNSSADMGEFSVWGWYGKDDTNSYNVFDNETVSRSDNSWDYTGGTRYWIPGYEYNFYGVYPVKIGSCTANGLITVNDFDCSNFGENAVDLMTATANRTLSNPIQDDESSAVAMEFKHTLTRIVFSAKLANGLDNGYSLQVNEIALWASNIGTMTQDMSQPDSQPVWITEPYLHDGDDEGDINEEYNAYLYRLTTADGALQSAPIPTGDAVLLNLTEKGDLLVIPQKMSETRPVLAINYTLSYGGSTTSSIWKVYPLKGNIDWTPGASLNYTFTIDEDNAYFNISVGDWIDGNSGNEDVEFN